MTEPEEKQEDNTEDKETTKDNIEIDEFEDFGDHSIFSF